MRAGRALSRLGVALVATSLLAVACGAAPVPPTASGPSSSDLGPGPLVADSGTPPPPLHVTVLEFGGVGVTPLNVTFVGNVTGGVSPYTFYWAFENGEDGTGNLTGCYQTSPCEVWALYQDTGYHNGSLTVLDSLGAQATVPYSVQVLEENPAGLSVRQSVLPSSGPAPLFVTFSANATGPDPPYSYLWTVAGVMSTTDPDFVYSFTTPGQYRATLLVTSPEGGVFSATTEITVDSSPIAKPSTKNPGPTPEDLYVLGLGLIVLLVGGILVLVGRRRGRRRRLQHPVAGRSMSTEETDLPEASIPPSSQDAQGPGGPGP